MGLNDMKLYLIGLAVLLLSCNLVLAFTTPEKQDFLNEEPHYHSEEALLTLFARLSKKYPTLAKVHSLGTSAEGRDLTVIQISSNAGRRDLLKPMFKYVANMHGDETVGREMLIYLAQYLLDNYQILPEITKIVDSTDIWLMPSMNPDGYARSQEGLCESRTRYIGRGNARNVDLNRDFPDRFESSLVQRLKPVTQPETVAMMKFITQNPFVLSANLHGGAVVASYPYDNSINHNECCTDSPTPDDAMFRQLALTYAQNHPTMKSGHNCEEIFPDGITNGAHWYELNGGMQDFNYVNSNCFDITLELSCCKFPNASSLAEEWHMNKRSLIEYMKMVHQGVRGIVTDHNGYPLQDMEVLVEGLQSKPVRTTSRGEFWRLLMPGQYNIQVIGFGYEPSEIKHVTIDNKSTATVNFSMTPSQTIEEIKGSFAEIERKFPTIASFDANENELSMNFPSLTVTAEIGSPQETKLHILVMGSFFDTSPLGRELTLNLARHVVAGYSLQEPPLVRLLTNAVIHFIPFTDDFDFVLGQYSRNESVCDPITREEFADKLLSPENNKKKSLFLNMLKSNRFDMALTFSAGGFDIQSPRQQNDNSIYEKVAMKIAESKLRESHDECALNPLRIHQSSTLEKITQFFPNSYQLPLYSIQVSCCKMPRESQISSIWRESIHKTLNFLKLTETGVKGSIRNAQSAPIRLSTVTVLGDGLTMPVTKNMAYFRFILPAGQYDLQINATDAGLQTLPVNLIDGQTLDLGNILLEQRHSASYQTNEEQNFGVAEVRSVFGGKIDGRILDERNHPIKGAQITLMESKDRLSNTSDENGKFQLTGAPFGTVTLEVVSYGHETATRKVIVNQNKQTSELIFRLAIDEDVMGLPRMIFVLLFGCMGAFAVAGCALLITCCSKRQKNKKYYSFSLLPQKPEQRKLFEDDDDVDETELFRTPIKGKLQPYYDDDQDPIMDTDELDSEEDIILVGNAKKHEYHD